MKDKEQVRKGRLPPPSESGGKPLFLTCSAQTVVLILLLMVFVTVAACRQAERSRVPSEVNEVITNIGEQIAQERYEQIYNESSELWKKDVTLEQSNEVFKTLRTKLGRVETRSLNSAIRQENSGGVLKGHVYIVSYETHFERGDGMETFTLIEENGRWLLARYFVNSTALK
ncbi:MAG TPA: DUF4019 domain-containing protein [Pyrinomonadaceae bacterium]|nr:DUF4019 domain-containing protein [Pyrinomonadaceae bacterium]